MSVAGALIPDRICACSCVRTRVATATSASAPAAAAASASASAAASRLGRAAPRATPRPPRRVALSGSSGVRRGAIVPHAPRCASPALRPGPPCPPCAADTWPACVRAAPIGVWVSRSAVCSLSRSSAQALAAGGGACARAGAPASRALAHAASRGVGRAAGERASNRMVRAKYCTPTRTWPGTSTDTLRYRDQIACAGCPECILT